MSKILPYCVRKVLLGLRPKPRQGAVPLGTRNEFDVFMSEPGTDNTRFVGKMGGLPPHGVRKVLFKVYPKSRTIEKEGL